MIKTVSFMVAGASYHTDNIEKILYENDDYNLPKSELMEIYGTSEKIFKYYADAVVKLVPEPDNEYDPNAIRVEADGMLIGYIKKTETAKAKELLESPDYLGVEIDDIWYKDYKELDEDEDGKIAVTKDVYDEPWVKILIKTKAPDQVQPEQAPSVNEASSFEPEAKKKRSASSVLCLVVGIFVLLVSALLAIGAAIPEAVALLVIGIILLILARKKK